MATTVTSNKFIKLIGNKYFHSRLSSWSILSRGKVQRNHIIIKMRKNVLPKNHTIPGI